MKTLFVDWGVYKRLSKPKSGILIQDIFSNRLLNKREDLETKGDDWKFRIVFMPHTSFIRPVEAFWDIKIDRNSQFYNVGSDCIEIMGHKDDYALIATALGFTDWINLTSYLYHNVFQPKQKYFIATMVFFD